jgi:hypothetical protein
MKKYLFGLFALALLGSLLPAQALAAGNDPAACGTASCSIAGCGAAACGTAGCNACGDCCSHCDCCPHCGCRLVPVCHIYCEPKKVTTYKYGLCCEEKCVPRPTCPCKGCGCCDGSGQCTGGDGNNACQECCGNGCCIHEVRKLVKYPCVKEVPVRKCWVEWVCPSCGNCCNGESTPASGQPSPAPAAPAPAPPQTTALPPRLSAANLVQMP